MARATLHWWTKSGSSKKLINEQASVALLEPPLALPLASVGSSRKDVNSRTYYISLV